MSQQRPALWAAEDEIEEDFQGVDMNLAIGNYGQNGMYDDVQSRIDEAALLAVQQQMAQQAAFAQIPDTVKRFIVHFHQAVLNNNLEEITVAYESGWTRLTEKFYAKTEWPEAEVIAPLVNDDPIFLILYRELYYRHVYSRLQPNIDDRFHSYENSCELFNYLLNSEGPVPLDLPEQWLWDIIDEFIYQFQSYCVWRSRVKNKSDEELAMLQEAAQASVNIENLIIINFSLDLCRLVDQALLSLVWSAYSVLNVLYSLIQKSKINEYIAAQQQGKTEEELAEIVGEYGSRPLYRMLGYFSIIGLLRVHTMLGDFTLALKVMEGVELNQKTPFTRVTACHVATYYYVGFCYIMLQRYPDAIRTFVSVLNFILRMRQYHTRSYQYDQINKTADRMYALFAICNALSPSRVDDNILNVVKERYGEQSAKMTRGEEGIPAFEELFIYACPKFISANPPPYEDPSLLPLHLNLTEPAQRHLSLFLSSVRSQLSVPTLRSFLKLYTSLDAKKLAGFVDADEEEMVQGMMAMKMGCRSVVGGGVGGQVGRGEGTLQAESGKGLLEGTLVSTSDLDFVIAENMVHIVESTVGRRYAGWFIRNTEHAQRVLDSVKNSRLPTPPQKAAPPGPAAPAEAAAKVGQKVTWGGVKVA
ncbi:hypothetical protein JAAARDRAFT_197946 [Jaapia argillacea MUCL 33604]|uniref:Eukaryotic translation initiation factor 3 subunit L n=1 Tax=Jaapia argillacea MUCL 33604 TaxID=933084 RepID=A0A067PGA6_9AGAM|nr:hypothetical protein JAAARDRAFT_197946 [Jaapia argillacea MUCL 33604]